MVIKLARVLECMIILDLLDLHVKPPGPTIRYVCRTKFGSTYKAYERTILKFLK